MHYYLHPSLDIDTLGGNAPLTYLLNEQFTTDESAPLASPRSAEPGPGTWTIVDTGNNMSISGDFLQIAAQVVNWSNPRIYSGTYTRAAGLSFYWRVDRNANANRYGGIGTSNNPGSGGTGIEAGLRLFGNSGLTLIETTSFVLQAPQDFHDIISVLKATGAYDFGYDGTNWKLLWPRYTGSSANLYYTNYSTTPADNPIDTVRISTLPVFADSSFITESISGALSGNETFTHTPDGWLTFTMTTLPGASNISVYFREQDGSNKWEIRISSAGDYSLYEIVATTPTLIVNAAGVLAGGEKLRIMFDGTTITGYYDNAQAWTYGSASNFQTATSGFVGALKFGAAISDLETLPRKAQGAYETQLQQIAAGA